MIAIVPIATRGVVRTGDVILAAALGTSLVASGLVVALWVCFVLGGPVAALCVAFGLRA